MVLVFLFSTGCGLKQKTDLGLINFQNSFDLLGREMIYGALFRLLPAQDVICFDCDGIWLIVLIEIQLLQLVLLCRFIGNWSRVLF